jgi:DNA-binding winged helix-turn-helix (wHTH) protein
MAGRIKYFYEFGEFRFDAERKVLSRNGESIGLPPKATDVLAVLLEERGSLVEREHLLTTVWQDTFVEDGNINNAISTLRKTLGGSDIIETVPRRGYRFTAEISKVGEEEIEELILERRTVTQTTITAGKLNLHLVAVLRRGQSPQWD